MTENNRYKREVAVRLFSDDLKGAKQMEKDESDEFAAQYTRTRSGAVVNRVFIVGTALECEDFGGDSPFWKVKVSDPKGVFSCTVGQYSTTHAQDAVENLETPCFVAIVGKVKMHEYNDKELFDIAIESITPTNVDTYDRWCKETERLTAERTSEE